MAIASTGSSGYTFSAMTFGFDTSNLSARLIREFMAAVGVAAPLCQPLARQIALPIH